MKSKQVVYDCATGQTRIEEVEVEEIIEDLPIIQEPTLEEKIMALEKRNQAQDIEIGLNQDAINFMLFAPTTMSVNDESKNSKGVNTMAAYLANQILKGRLDYTLVVGRYGEFKEDIDTILISEGKQDLIK